MSLINNYLKKTRLEGGGSVPETDVPPLIKSAPRKRKAGSALLRVVSLGLFAVLLIGGVVVYHQTGALEAEKFAHAREGQVRSEPAEISRDAVAHGQTRPPSGSAAAETTVAVSGDPVSPSPKDQAPPASAETLAAAPAAPAVVAPASDGASERAVLARVQPEREPSKGEVAPVGETAVPGNEPEVRKETVQPAHETTQPIERGPTVQAPRKEGVPETDGPVVTAPEKRPAPEPTALMALAETEPAGKPPVAAPQTRESRPTRPVTVQEQTRDRPDETRISNFNSPTLEESQVNNFFQIALVAQREGDYIQAARFYSEVLRHRPDHVQSMTNLSVTFMKMGEELRAREMIGAILRKEPDNAGAYVNLGLMDLNGNNYSGAEENFRKALELHPREITALTNMAYLARRQNDLQAVERYYQRILSLDPRNLNVLLAYAGVMEQKKDLQGAADLYIEALASAEASRNVDMARQIRERLSIINYYAGGS